MQLEMDFGQECGKLCRIMPNHPAVKTASRADPVKPHPLLPGFQPGRYDNYFLAAVPPPYLAGQLYKLAYALRHRFGLSGDPIEAVRLHMSFWGIHYYDHVPPFLAKELTAAFDGWAMPQPEIRFDQAMSFSGSSEKNPFVLVSRNPCEAWKEFRFAVGERMKWAGLGRFVRGSFTPHVTLLYDRQIVPPTDIEPICWTGGALALVQSHVGLSEHEHVERWELQG